MHGFVADCAWYTSNCGSSDSQSSASCAHEVSRSAQLPKSPPTADAGGGRPVTSGFIQLYPIATSTASERRCLKANLNFPNRRIRTRTSGGVGGEREDELGAPYPDPMCIESTRRKAARNPAADKFVLTVPEGLPRVWPMTAKTGNDEAKAGPRAWRTPEIIDVGAVAEVTKYDPQYTLRDNQGSTPVAYKVGTLRGTDEVDLDNP
jgi:hypothetical protein